MRFANLRAGDLDMIERLAATDVASARADPSLAVADVVSLGYQAITVNVANGERSQNPRAQDARVRRALSLAINRAVINDVVFEGAAQPGNQPVAPDSPWYDARFPVPARDIETAKALLAEARYERVAVEWSSPTTRSRCK